MTKVVRPWVAASSAACNCFSVSASSAEVASSNTMIGGSLSSARAMETRWRSPPESDRPRSPTSVLTPVALPRDKFARLRPLRARARFPRGWRRACRRAGFPRSSAQTASAPGTPRRCCGARRESFRSRISTPSMRIAPACGSMARCSRLSVVDLPEPVAPTSATVSPGVTTKFTSLTALAPVVIGESDVLEAHFAVQAAGVLARPGLSANAAMRVHDAEEFGDLRRLHEQVVDETDHLLQPGDQHGGEIHEGDDLADAGEILQMQPDADAEKSPAATGCRGRARRDRRDRPPRQHRQLRGEQLAR